MAQQRISQRSVSGIALAMCIVFSSLFVIPVSAQAPGFGGAFYAAATGTIDLTFASGGGTGGASTGVPIPTTGPGPVVVLGAALALLGGAALRRRRSVLP